MMGKEESVVVWEEFVKEVDFFAGGGEGVKLFGD